MTNMTQRQQNRRKLMAGILLGTVASLGGCGDATVAEDAEAIGTKTSALFGVDAEWFGMANAKAKDVAVGRRDQIWIVNTSNDVYKWNWRDGQFSYGDPAGGSWSVLPDPPGNSSTLRIASSSQGVLWAVAGNTKVYRHTGSAWEATNSPGNAQDVAVGADGTPFISTYVNGHFYTYKFNGSSWSQVGPNFQQDRLAVTIANTPIVRVNVNSSFGIFGTGRYSAASNSWTLEGKSSFADLGGIDERDLDYQTYELWVVISPEMRLAHYETNSLGTKLTKTAVTANAVAASRSNEVVVRLDTSNYVRFTTGFHMS